MNAPGLYCELSLGEQGSLTWECRPFSGGAARPAEIAGMVLAALGSEPRADCPCGSLAPFPGVTLEGAAGRVLREHGMQVLLRVLEYDDARCEVHAEIEVTTPARRDRGTAHVDDERARSLGVSPEPPCQRRGPAGRRRIAVTIDDADAASWRLYAERLADELTATGTLVDREWRRALVNTPPRQAFLPKFYVGGPDGRRKTRRGGPAAGEPLDITRSSPSEMADEDTRIARHMTGSSPPSPSSMSPRCGGAGQAWRDHPGGRSSRRSDLGRGTREIVCDLHRDGFWATAWLPDRIHVRTTGCCHTWCHGATGDL
jgi:hypothetical protein